MKNETNSLLTKGIILQSGEICQDKINLISGAMTAPLIETIWVFSGYNVAAIKRLSDILNRLYSAGKWCEILDILRILYDVVGMEFPEEVELLIDHPEAQRYFLFSFLLDINDCKVY